MHSILIVVDGPQQAEAVARHVAWEARQRPSGPIHLLNVQPPLSAYITRFLDRRTVQAFRLEEGEKALAGPKRILGEAGLAFESHLCVGEAAEAIAATAEKLGADEILMGAEGLGPLGRGLFQWLVSRVVRRTDVPVTIVKNPRSQTAAVESRDHWSPALSR